MVGANPNPDLQIQYSQIFVTLYLDLDCIYGFKIKFTNTLNEVFGFGFYLQMIRVFEFGFASRGFVPTSGDMPSNTSVITL